MSLESFSFFWGDFFSSGEKVVLGVFSHQFFVIFKRLNKLPDFIFKFKQVVKDCFKFIYIHIFYSQNWLNCFMNYHHLVRLKEEKKTLASHAWIKKVCLFLFGSYRQKWTNGLWYKNALWNHMYYIGETINWLTLSTFFFPSLLFSSINSKK